MSMNCMARLDYDSRDALRDGVRRLRSARMIFAPMYNGPVLLRRYRTRNGWHVELYADIELQPAEIVALQAILGSDYRREMFNLFRVRQLAAAPSFWRRLSHWNVLHRERLC